MYGDRIRGDQRIVLWLGDGGRTYLATQTGNGVNEWRRTGDWSATRRSMTFLDTRTQQRFDADLSRGTLGGLWRDGRRNGGWWCARRPEAVSLGGPGPRGADQEFFVPPLVPDLMDSPRFPIVAIREAKEGSAVVCFLVDAGGIVRDPEILELSDEIFEAPTLLAITRSRYRPLRRGSVMRPGCRHYTYELEQYR